MPPRLHLQPNPPDSSDPGELDRAIATQPLRLDRISVAVTSDQPGQPDPLVSDGPVADRARYDPAVHHQPNPTAAPTPSPRVLIADDAPAMRAALRGLLEDADLAVIGEAADGLQAVTMAADLQPDVVVMDVRMPGLDGIQATTRIIGAHPSIRVVVYSVFDSDETQYAARQAGATAFVPKHAPPDQVPAAVLATWQAASTPNPPAAPPSGDPR
jgi:CheY-like chemotaxis protein